MTTHIGLLRAVNLGAHNQVSMGALRDLLAELGLTNPRTLLQSGNVVFESSARSVARLEQDLEAAVAQQLGVTTAFFIRTAAEWEAIIKANPFRAEARSDPGHLLLLALKSAPTRAAATALQQAITGREVVRVVGRQAYAVYPDGIGRSRLSTALIESRLGTRATGRNWNTVLKLGALSES